MPLTDQSPLENALSRIIGAPSSAGTSDQSSFQLAPRGSLINYGASPMDYSAMNVNLGAAQPVAPTIPPVSTASAPAAPATPTAPAAPQITYAQQLRNDLALSGITGAQADGIVNSSLQAGGWNASTPYDPTNKLMKVN